MEPIHVITENKEDKDNTQDIMYTEIKVEYKIIILQVIEKLNTITKLEKTCIDYTFYQGLDWSDSISVIVFICYLIDSVINVNNTNSRNINGICNINGTNKTQVYQECGIILYNIIIRWLQNSDFKVYYESTQYIEVKAIYNNKITSNIIQELNNIRNTEDIAIIINIVSLGVIQLSPTRSEVVPTKKNKHISKKRSLGTKLCCCLFRF